MAICSLPHLPAWDKAYAKEGRRKRRKRRRRRRYVRGGVSAEFPGPGQAPQCSVGLVSVASVESWPRPATEIFSKTPHFPTLAGGAAVWYSDSAARWRYSEVQCSEIELQ